MAPKHEPTEPEVQCTDVILTSYATDPELHNEPSLKWKSNHGTQLGAGKNSDLTLVQTNNTINSIADRIKQPSTLLEMKHGVLIW